MIISYLVRNFEIEAGQPEFPQTDYQVSTVSQLGHVIQGSAADAFEVDGCVAVEGQSDVQAKAVGHAAAVGQSLRMSRDRRLVGKHLVPPFG